MPYAQIHTQALRHRKVLSLSADAFRIWIAGHCYCQEHLTDGEIPKVALVALGVPVKPKWVAELVAEALWHDHDGVYTVHDWADWNDTRAQVERRKTAAKERREKWLAKRAEDAHANAVANAYPNGVANAEQDRSATQRNATLTQRTAPQRVSKQVPEAATEADNDGFAAFWDAYPRHTDKVDALKAWQKLKPTEALQAILLAAVAEQRTWRTWADVKFVPHAATWLRHRRWDDERPPDDRARAPTGPPPVVSPQTWREIQQQEIAALKAEKASRSA